MPELGTGTRVVPNTGTRWYPVLGLGGTRYWVPGGTGLKTGTGTDQGSMCMVHDSFSQQPGVDYEETFAPVSRSMSLRILISLAATYDLELEQADIEGAYLNGQRFDREIYMRIPAGYTISTSPCTALQLIKTLYGLKQSGREWWKVLGEALSELAFTRCENEWGLYVLRDKQGHTMGLLLAYVDDLVIAARTLPEIDQILNRLSKKWKISKLGPVTHILGAKVTQDRTRQVAYIMQTAYIDSLMEQFPGHSTSIAKHAPLPVRSNVSTNADDVPAALTGYQELVGCLLWISGCTRPDVLYPASYLSRFVASPTDSHWQLALQVVSYLVHTRTLGITLGGTAPRPRDVCGCGLGRL